MKFQVELTKNKFEITRSKPRQPKKKKEAEKEKTTEEIDLKKIMDAIDKNEQKKNPVIEHIKHMSWKKKLIYGGIATAVVMKALDKDELKQSNIQYQQIQQQPTIQPSIKQGDSLNTILNTSKTVAAKEEIINPISISASELLSKYSKATEYSDEKALNDYYKNKYLEITGSVESVVDNNLVIENGSTDKWYSDWMTVKCNIENQEELVELNQIQIGDQVIVTGLCEGLDGLSFQMYDCYINSAELKR